MWRWLVPVVLTTSCLPLQLVGTALVYGGGSEETHHSQLRALETAPSSTIVRDPSVKTFALVNEIDQPACLSSGELAAPTCFVGFRPRFDEALGKVLAGMLTTNAVDPDYHASVNQLHLSLAFDHGYRGYAIDWEFTLEDRSGRTIVHLADRFVNHRRVDWMSDAELQHNVASMQAAVLDRIAAAVAQSEAAQS